MYVRSNFIKPRLKLFNVTLKTKFEKIQNVYDKKSKTLIF